MLVLDQGGWQLQVQSLPCGEKDGAAPPARSLRGCVQPTCIPSDYHTRKGAIVQILSSVRPVACYDALEVSSGCVPLVL